MIFESEDGAICYAHAPKCCSRTVLGWFLLAEHPYLFQRHPEWFLPHLTKSHGEYHKIREKIFIHRVNGNAHHFENGVLPAMSAKIRIAVARSPVDRFVSGFKNRVLFHRALGDTKVDLGGFIADFERFYKENNEINTHFRPLHHFIGRDVSVFTHVFTPETLFHLRGFLSARYQATLPDLRLQSTDVEIEVTPEQVAWINEHFAVDAEDYAKWEAAAQETAAGSNKELWSNEFERKKRVISSTDSVVLVGNGPSVLDYNLGAVIDSFDKVIRFNAFQISGIEKQVGSKTSYWSTHGGCTALPRGDNLPKRGILVYETSQAGLPLEEIWRVPWGFYNNVRKRLRAESKQENREIIGPTSGLVVALWLLESEKVWNIHLAGFDHFRKNRSRRHHYWLEKSYSRPLELDGEAEARILQSYVRTGRVRYLT